MHNTGRRTWQEVLLAGLLLPLMVGGCGMFGGNKGEVCDDSKKALEQYVAQVKAASADDAAQWKQATDKLAGQFDALAKKADDGALSKTLREEAGRYRTAAGTVGTGDAAALNKTLSEAPQRLGKACD